MAERPILFSAPMVRALLAGTKTQTRRVVKGLPERSLEFDRQWHANVLAPAGSIPDRWSWWDGPPHGQSIYHLAQCPYGVAGDTLWVREAWSPEWSWRHEKPRDIIPSAPVWYWADRDPTDRDYTKPKPSIHMPRWASRITLRVTDVRVERLNEIGEGDCIAEGIERPGISAPFWKAYLADHNPTLDPQVSYAGLWEHINGPGSWAANPWVWAVSFERVT